MPDRIETSLEERIARECGLTPIGRDLYRNSDGNKISIKDLYEIPEFHNRAQSLTGKNQDQSPNYS